MEPNWPRPAGWFITMLVLGAAFALWLIITGGEPLWR
jgi:hypothetical protein